MTTLMTIAISALCRIVSLRPRSGRLTSSPSQDFSRSRACRQTPRNPSATDRRMRPSVRAAAIAEALPPGRTVRATAFRTGVRDPIGRSPSATMAIATIGTDAMVVPGSSGLIAIRSPSRREKPTPILRPPPLPSFITASPRPNNTEPVAGAPTPEAEASPTPMATPEAGPSGLESPSEGNAAFQPRGRRRRLRSPYGFGGANSGEAEQPDATPETADDSPVRE